MVYLRNPFKIRAFEHLEPDSDDLFLTLFSPDVLSLLKTKNIWRVPVFIRSSPGGGKTTLLKLFSTPTLKTLHRLRGSSEEFKELFATMKEIGALDESGLKMAGVYIPFSQTYSSIEDLDIDDNKKNKLLFSLLNSRVILATLRTLCESEDLEYPKEVERITLKEHEGRIYNFNGSSVVTGKMLYDWSIQIESSICRALDSISLEPEKDLDGHSSILLNALSPSNILIDKVPFEKKLVLLFDDFHNLTKRQNIVLRRLIIDSRITYPLWISERTQILDLTNLLFENQINTEHHETSFGSLKPFLSDSKIKRSPLVPGAREGRDFDSFNLEKLWRDKPAKFQKNVIKIGNLRLRAAEDLNFQYLHTLLQEELDGKQYETKFIAIKDEVLKRLNKKIGDTSRYKEWLENVLEMDGKPIENAIECRALEILIERDKKNRQQTLDDVELPREEFNNTIDSAIRGIARFFISSEFNVPYYYGSNILARVSHLNVEQFLLISGEMFEEIRARHRFRKSPVLTPKRQHEIIKNVAKNKWNEVVEGPSATEQTRRFLEEMGKLLYEKTFDPRASYLGVTGLAIRTNEIKLLQKSKDSDLKQVLEICLANNFLEARTTSQQNEDKTVFYLNRLLCVRFNLPLNYGGFQNKRIVDLEKWTDERK